MSSNCSKPGLNCSKPSLNCSKPSLNQTKLLQTICIGFQFSFRYLAQKLNSLVSSLAKSGPNWTKLNFPNTRLDGLQSQSLLWNWRLVCWHCWVVHSVHGTRTFYCQGSMYVTGSKQSDVNCSNKLIDFVMVLQITTMEDNKHNFS